MQNPKHQNSGQIRHMRVARQGSKTLLFSPNAIKHSLKIKPKVEFRV